MNNVCQYSLNVPYPLLLLFHNDKTHWDSYMEKYGMNTVTYLFQCRDFVVKAHLFPHMYVVCQWQCHTISKSRAEIL